MYRGALRNALHPTKQLGKLLLQRLILRDCRAVDVHVLGGKKTEGVGGGDRHDVSVLSYTHISIVMRAQKYNIHSHHFFV